MKHFVKPIALWCFILTSACGGGGGGVSLPGSGGDFPQPSDSIAAINQFDSLVATEGFTNPANYPVTPGAVNYTGVVTLQRFGAQYYGELDMDVTFAINEFDGTMDNFNTFNSSTPTATATDVAGSFSLVGDLTGVNSLFQDGLTGVAFGTLDNLADVMTIRGKFAGTNAEGVELSLSGGVFSGVANGD